MNALISVHLSEVAPEVLAAELVSQATGDIEIGTERFGLLLEPLRGFLGPFSVGLAFPASLPLGVSILPQRLQFLQCLRQQCPQPLILQLGPRPGGRAHHLRQGRGWLGQHQAGDQWRIVRRQPGLLSLGLDPRQVEPAVAVALAAEKVSGTWAATSLRTRRTARRIAATAGCGPMC